MASSIEPAASRLLAGLRERDELAAELRLRARGSAAVFSVVFGEDDDEPVFRVREQGGRLHLDVRQQDRWASTPEAGAVPELVDVLTGPLRFVWFLHAEDARFSREGGS